MEQFSLDATLKREILLSEKLRAKLLMLVFIYAIGILFILRIFFGEYFLLLLPSLSLIYLYQATLLVFVIREFAVFKVISKRLKDGKDFNDKFRYMSNFIEISYPTIALVILGMSLDSVVILFTPIVYFYFLILILSTLSLEFKISFFSGIVAAAGYMMVFLMFENRTSDLVESNYLTNNILHGARALLLIMSGAVAGLVANQLQKRVRNVNNALLERQKIVNMFGQQVSSSIVDELINNDNEIKSVEKYVCVMFLDIRGFTKFSQHKTPEEIIGYQNKVFGFMIDIIIKHNGVINQFLGDGYMATFGVPLSKGNDSQNAVNAALEIIEELTKKNDTGEIPTTRIGIGLHSRLVIAGNVGTEERKQYSISGNTVIMASRIEQLNKTYKSQLLLSKETLYKVDTPTIEPTLLGNVELRGREEPVEIWKLK